MSESDRASVRTYVPSYQKERWAEHADELNMSLSEFVRTMVQAGRSDLEIPPLEDTEPPEETTNTATNDLETSIITALETEGELDWEGIVAHAIGDVETELEATLQALQEAGRVAHSPRSGTYSLT